MNYSHSQNEYYGMTFRVFELRLIVDEGICVFLDCLIALHENQTK